MHSHDYDVRGILASMTSTERVAIFDARYAWACAPGLINLSFFYCLALYVLYFSNVPSVTLLLSKMSGPLGSCSPISPVAAQSRR